MYIVSLRTKQFTNGDLRQMVMCKNRLPTEVLGVRSRVDTQVNSSNLWQVVFVYT